MNMCECTTYVNCVMLTCPLPLYIIYNNQSCGLIGKLTHRQVGRKALASSYRNDWTLPRILSTDNPFHFTIRIPPQQKYMTRVRTAKGSLYFELLGASFFLIELLASIHLLVCIWYAWVNCRTCIFKKGHLCNVMCALSKLSPEYFYVCLTKHGKRLIRSVCKITCTCAFKKWQLKF